MAITNPTPQPKEVVILQRDDGNSFYEEVHISGSSKIIYIDSSGYLNADDSASFYTVFPPGGGSGGTAGSASWASSSLVAISASFASSSISASYAKSSSWANTASWAIDVVNNGMDFVGLQSFS